MMGEVIFPPAFLSFVLDSGNHLAETATSDKSGETILVTTDDTTAPQLPRAINRFCAA
jgi:hypothetical protein